MAPIVHPCARQVPFPHGVTSLLRARLGGATLGLPAQAVREIVRAVAITPLPGAPAIIEGVIDLRGVLVPIVDARARLALTPRTLDPSEFMVVLEAGERLVAVRVDEVEELLEISPDAVHPPAELSPTLRHLAGLVAGAEGIVMICDVAAFVSQAEGDALDAALASRA